MASLHAELFCDPFAVAGWRYRPVLKRVAYTYPELSWTLRPTVAFPDPLEGDDAATYARDARRAADAVGLPVDADPLEDGVPASWTACEALVAARAADPDGAMELYHRLSAATFAGGQPPATAAAVADVAAEIDGLDADSIRDAVGSHRATAALGRELAIGADMFDRIDEHEVRGTPGRLRLDARLVDDGASAPSPAAENDGAADTDAEDGGPTDETDSDDPDPAVVPSPPVVRITAGKYTVVVDPAQGYQEFSDVFGRYDPDMGRDLWKEERYGRKVIQAYNVGQRTAENLSGENYDEKARRVLAATGESFVADVAACTTLDPDTCRLALRRLGADDDVTTGPHGGWRLLPNRED
jgi:predicted DsbA family dithiol-disulfide isomerase